MKIGQFLNGSPRHNSIPVVESIKMASATKHSSQRMIEKQVDGEATAIKIEASQPCKTQQSRYKNNSSNMLRHSFKEEE